MTAAFDLQTMLGTFEEGSENKIQQIPVENLIPYHNHKFQLYTGERKEDMEESIRQNGILTPLIVQPLSTSVQKYEILIGHNRWNCAKSIGKATVPAIVKTGLTAEEAEMYVIESNIIQRGFNNLKVSEQAAVIAQRHHEMFSQGKRNDIIKELKILNGESVATFDALRQKSNEGVDTAKNIASDYGLCRTFVVQLIRINKLNDDLKEWIDSKVLAIRSGVELSFLSEEEQRIVFEQAKNFKIDMKIAKQLRNAAGTLTKEKVHEIVSGMSDAPKRKAVRVSYKTYSRYFPEGTATEEIEDVISKALAFYFSTNIDESKQRV